MSVYSLSTRMSSVENSVDELGQKADSSNAVLPGTTTVNGLAVLNGPVALGSNITGISTSDVNDWRAALGAKAPINSPTVMGAVSGVSKAMFGLGKRRSHDRREQTRIRGKAEYLGRTGLSGTLASEKLPNLTDNRLKSCPV